MHASAEMVSAGRRLIQAAALTIREDPGGSLGTILDFPREAPSIEESLRGFVPTAICFDHERQALSGLEILTDYDRPTSARYLSALYVAEGVRWTVRGITYVQAARAFFAPPARIDEFDERSRRLGELGVGTCLKDAQGAPSRQLTGRLTPSERARASRLALLEQVALTAVLAARQNVAAAFSPSGRWPRRFVVEQVAERLGVRIARFSLDGIPPDVLTELREARYEPAPVERGQARV